MSPEGWYRAKRFMSLICGLSFMALGGYFSAVGFGIKNPNLFIVGVVFAIAVIVIEMMFQNEGTKNNKTLTIFGIFVYAYDWFTNFLGLMVAYSITTNFFLSENIPELFMAAMAAIMLSWLPEPMVSWGLTGHADTDFVGRLLDLAGVGWKNFNNEQSGDYGFSNQKKNRQPEFMMQSGQFGGKKGQQQSRHEIPEDVQRRRNEFQQKRKGGQQSNNAGMFRPSGEDEIEQFLRNLDRHENGN